MQLVDSGCLNMFNYIQKNWIKSSFLESFALWDSLLYPTENELSGSRNWKWNIYIWIWKTIWKCFRLSLSQWVRYDQFQGLFSALYKADNKKFFSWNRKVKLKCQINFLINWTLSTFNFPRTQCSTKIIFPRFRSKAE